MGNRCCQFGDRGLRTTRFTRLAFDKAGINPFNFIGHLPDHCLFAAWQFVEQEGDQIGVPASVHFVANKKAPFIDEYLPQLPWHKVH
jgi:hypothetical protein